MPQNSFTYKVATVVVSLSEQIDEITGVLKHFTQGLECTKCSINIMLVLCWVEFWG